MADEEIVLQITVDSDSARKDVENLTKAIEGNRSATKELEEENRRLAKSGQQNSQQYRQNAETIAINKNELSQLNRERKRAISSAQAETGSLTDLRNQLAKLTESRNRDLQVGSEAFDMANADIKELNDRIKEAEQAGGDFRRSVGNYSTALENAGEQISTVNPALGGMVSGIQGAIKAALAFIATPLGATLAAITLALKAVSTFFSRTEEGGDQLAVGMAFLNSILESSFDVISRVGKLLVEVFINQFNLIVNSFKIQALALEEVILGINVAWQKAFGSVEDYERAQAELEANTQEIIKLGKEQVKIVGDTADAFSEAGSEIATVISNTKELAFQSAELQRRENELNRTIRQNTVDEAKRRQGIQENLLITRDFTKSFEERSAALRRANQLEREQLAATERIAQEEFDLAKARDAQFDSNAEGLDEVAEAEANLINVRTESLKRQRELLNRVTEQENRERAERKKREDDQAKRDADKAKKDEEEAKAEQERIKKQQEATFNLELFRKERDATEIEDAQTKAQKLIEAEEFRRDQLLLNQDLIETERELIIEESEQRVIEIKADAANEQLRINQERIAKERKEEEQQQAFRVAQANTYLGVLSSTFKAAGQLAGENTKLQRALAIVGIAIDTARGIMNSFATLPYPAAIIASAGIAITGATQLANVKSQNTSGTGGGGNISAVSASSLPSTQSRVDTTEADNAQLQREALQNAIGNLGLTVSVTEINEAQQSVSVSEETATI